MITNVFFNDSTTEVDGIIYPACWTETVAETTETEDGLVETEVVKLKPAFVGYQKRPDICGEYQGKLVYYLAMDSDREADQLQAIKGSGTYLCASYEQMALLDQELYKSVMECDSENGRIKLKDYTGDIDQVKVYAPVKVAGVDVQDRPDEPEEMFPTVFDKLSQAELYFRRLKETVKTQAIAFIKANPECDSDALFNAINDDVLSAVLYMMLPYYVQGAAQARLIEEPTFTAFRDFVVRTPIEILSAL